MKFTAVDIGNTAIKIVNIQDNESCVCVAMPTSIAEAVSICRDEGGEDIAFCTTRELTGEECERIKEVGWWEFNSNRLSPVKINYQTPGTLGADRIAGVLGAKRFFPGVGLMVADVGTALTLDILTAPGEFVGGNISPGIQMRLDALHKFTSRLPQVEWSSMDMKFGTDTRSALICGATWGLITEIAGCFELARKQYGLRLLVLTGGGAKLIERNLKESYTSEINIDYIPDLVSFGIMEAYYHDKKN